MPNTGRTRSDQQIRQLHGIDEEIRFRAWLQIGQLGLHGGRMLVQHRPLRRPRG
jgi:hypothetical protein